MKTTLNIVGLIILLLVSSCKKDKTFTNGFDSSFINLVDFDTIFVGNWQTMHQGEYHNINFNIPEQGNSSYVYSSFDPEDNYSISKVAQYHDNAIYLGEAKKMIINTYPVYAPDTLVLFNWVSGETIIPYSAIMTLDSETFYRLE